MKEQKQQNPKGYTSTQMLLREPQNAGARRAGTTETTGSAVYKLCIVGPPGRLPATASQCFILQKTAARKASKVLQKPCLQHNLKTDDARNVKRTINKKRKSIISQQCVLSSSQSLPISKQTAPSALAHGLPFGRTSKSGSHSSRWEELCPGVWAERNYNGSQFFR